MNKMKIPEIPKSVGKGMAVFGLVAYLGSAGCAVYSALEKINSDPGLHPRLNELSQQWAELKVNHAQCFLSLPAKDECHYVCEHNVCGSDVCGQVLRAYDSLLEEGVQIFDSEEYKQMVETHNHHSNSNMEEYSVLGTLISSVLLTGGIIVYFRRREAGVEEEE